MKRNFGFILPILAGGLLLAATALMWPRPVSAQCGSQASSCRNCHEAQGQDSVNAKGVWHVSHAFGDFCEFCHAGNVQATDKAAAHAGMISPLVDVMANCASCHPDNYVELAQGYATTLGVTIDAAAGGGAAAGGEGEGAAPSGTGPTPSAAQAPEAAPVQPAGFVDFNAQCAASPTGGPVNWGNVVTGALLATVVGGGGAYVYVNERKLRGLPAPIAWPTPNDQIQKPQTAPVAQPAIAEQQFDISNLKFIRPEVVELLPALQALEPRALNALRKILGDPEGGNELLTLLARIDPVLIEEVRRLDRQELNLLVALAGEK